MGYLIGLSLLVVLIWVLVDETKTTRKIKKRYGKKEFIAYGKFKPVLGPGLPPSNICSVIFLKSRIIVEMNGYEMSIATEKLMDVSIWTKEQIQKRVYSDAGGALAGGMIAGPIGAIIGGRGVSTLKSKTDYLIITYFSHEEIKAFAFDVSKDKLTAQRIERKYAWLKEKEKLRIDM